jgi:hypothetical protein
MNNIASKIDQNNIEYKGIQIALVLAIKAIYCQEL